MKKVVACNLHQVVKVDDELEIKAYYAGHVLGAAMFQVLTDQRSALNSYLFYCTQGEGRRPVNSLHRRLQYDS